MSKNALVITNRVRKIPGGIAECAIGPLQDLGYRVFWAADFSVAKFDLSEAPCELIQTNSRSLPFHPKNISTYRTLKKAMKEKEISLVSCHTPIGGFLGRIAAKKMHVPCVVYEAHGFLFFKNGPKLGWLYKLIERRLARYTNYLITINEEDYQNAQRFKLKPAGQCYMVHGSGMHLNFAEIPLGEKARIKTELGIDENQKVLISIGELNANKNVETLLKSLPLVQTKNWVLLVCGEGPHDKKLKNLANRLHIDDKVRFLGYRTDIQQLLSISDIYVTCSKREGLSRTVSEAMAARVLCVVSNRRGMKDLIDDKKGGFLFEPLDHKQLSAVLDNALTLNDITKQKLLDYSQNKIKNYTTEVVRNECLAILSTADEYLRKD